MTTTEPRPTTSASPPPTATGAPASANYRWIAMGVIVFGSFMVVLDTTVVNLGLASLQRDFELASGVEWVVTGYLAAVGIAQTTSGWLADRFGRKPMFVVAMIGFTLTSLACALAPTFPSLVAARVFQGVAGGLLMPIGMAMIYELFQPAERGRALGYFGIAIMVAPAVGPVLSGTLISSLSWRWLFLINLPVGLIGIPLAIRLLHDTGVREARSLDRVGLGLSAVGLGSFMVGLDQATGRGWTDPVTLTLLLVGVVGFGGFVRHVQRVRHPLVQLNILTSPVFRVAMLVVGLMTIAQYSRLVYLPLELTLLRGVPEFRVGLVLIPSALGMAATMPIGGRLVDRLGARLPVSIGAGTLGLSFVGLTMIDLDTPLPVISAILALGGLGAGLAVMAPNIVAMNSIETRWIAQASGLSNLTRQASAAIGVAALSAVFASVQPELATEPAATGDGLAAYRAVFVIAVVVLTAVVALAQFLPDKARALQLQAARSAEQPTDHHDPVEAI